MMQVTPDISLTPCRAADWPALHRLATHPHFYYRALNDRSAWIAWRTTRYILRAKVGDQFPAIGRKIKAIRSNTTGEMIGCVGLFDLHKAQKGQAETGTFVAVPYQGQKIGTIAGLRFLEWCVDRLDLQSLESTVHPNNQASIKMLTRSGLQPVGSITAEENKYFSREGIAEPRLVMRAERPDILKALLRAKSIGLDYAPIRVLD